ncbi:unannotated protein [freshwater metagenome]|uniref:Unannotated protein n=1 Tax=freshwater metagenome TaxID=449393 RepID=A0A6J6MH59_9ZZZZ
MPRLLASIIRFSIWSDMPRPCLPPTELASFISATESLNSLPLIETGRPCTNPIRTSSLSIETLESQNLTPMIGSTISIEVSSNSKVFAS